MASRVAQVRGAGKAHVGEAEPAGGRGGVHREAGSPEAEGSVRARA